MVGKLGMGKCDFPSPVKRTESRAGVVFKASINEGKSKNDCCDIKDWGVGVKLFFPVDSWLWKQKENGQKGGGL
ncbi:MAG: hypothetical protein ABSD57_14235 [Verrucomicrobiota bacterium]|jgi:hypothetical protein